jgi:primosomal protein N''
MLSFEDKVRLFEKSLCEKNNSYADVMKDEVHFYFFELENNLDFLKELKSEDEIRNKVDFLVSKLIMKEDEDGIHNLIRYYV